MYQSLRSKASHAPECGVWWSCIGELSIGESKNEKGHDFTLQTWDDDSTA